MPSPAADAGGPARDQAETEAGLADHLAAEEVAVERGVELVGLVGCDGAHSTVRRLVGIPFHGTAYEQAFVQADLEVGGPVGTEEERKELGGLFGTYGTKLWTAHRSLYELVPEIEDQWPEGPARDELCWFFRVAHSHNNQVLHSTALGLSGGVTRSTDSLGLDAGPSDRHLTGRCSARWTRSQEALELHSSTKREHMLGSACARVEIVPTHRMHRIRPSGASVSRPQRAPRSDARDGSVSRIAQARAPRASHAVGEARAYARARTRAGHNGVVSAVS